MQEPQALDVPSAIQQAAFETFALKRRLSPEELVALEHEIGKRLYADLDREFDLIVAAQPDIAPDIAAASAIAIYNNRKTRGSNWRARTTRQRGPAVKRPIVRTRRREHRSASSRRTATATSSASSGESDQGEPDPGPSDHHPGGSR